MDWTLALAAFVLGLVLGYVIHTLIVRDDTGKDQQKRAEQAVLELSQYKQSVTDLHQEQGRELAALAAQLEKVNRQWHEASDFLQIQESDLPRPPASLPDDETGKA
ncbi:ZapG family protein [Shewanella sp. GXUN23E]|uniref:ZapG family protein n=1 Tax=Shewanella sp. GXUN23E TaxID=3422498 RepID=UPI003D7E491B